MKTTLALSILCIPISQLPAQVKTKYPDLPRVDVHTHVAGDNQAIQNYLDVRDLLLAVSGY